MEGAAHRARGSVVRGKNCCDGDHRRRADGAQRGKEPPPAVLRAAFGSRLALAREQAAGELLPLQAQVVRVHHRKRPRTHRTRQRLEVSPFQRFEVVSVDRYRLLGLLEGAPLPLAGLSQSPAYDDSPLVLLLYAIHGHPPGSCTIMGERVPSPKTGHRGLGTGA